MTTPCERGKAGWCDCDGTCLKQGAPAAPAVPATDAAKPERVGQVTAPQPAPRSHSKRFVAGGFEDRGRGATAIVKVTGDADFPVLLDVWGGPEGGLALLRMTRREAELLGEALRDARNLYPDLDDPHGA